jgi:hypothetical protein
LLVGHAMTDPVLRTVFAARDGQRVGEVVYSIPNESFCRRLPFDNETAALSVRRRRAMSGQPPKVGVRGDRNLAWGTR